MCTRWPESRSRRARYHFLPWRTMGSLGILRARFFCPASPSSSWLWSSASLADSPSMEDIPESLLFIPGSSCMQQSQISKEDLLNMVAFC